MEDISTPHSSLLSSDVSRAETQAPPKPLMPPALETHSPASTAPNIPIILRTQKRH